MLPKVPKQIYISHNYGDIPLILHIYEPNYKYINYKKKGVNNQVWKVFLIKPQINEENVEKNAIERC